MPEEIQNEKTIFEFDQEAEVSAWESRDDVVMGGVSRSGLVAGTPGIAVFKGEVSLEQGGGFASVRSFPMDYDLSDFNGIFLRLRGDGKTYGFNLRTGATRDAPLYRAKVETRPGEWLEVQLPFSTFLPQSRRSTPASPDTPPLDPKLIKSFGFIISDKQAGTFELEIDTIKAYR